MKRLALLLFLYPLMGYSQVVTDPNERDQYYYMDDYSIIERTIIHERFMVAEYREITITVDNLKWVVGMRGPNLIGKGWISVLTPTGHLMNEPQILAFIKTHNICYPW